MSSNGYSVVPVQKAFMALRIIQVLLGIVVMGMAAYIVSLTTGYSYVFTPGAIGIFTAIATIIFTIYWFVANSTAGQAAYNYWAIWAVEFFVWVFWLTTFSLYASYVAGTLTYYDSSYSGFSSSSSSSTYCYAGYCVDVSTKRDLTKRYWTYDSLPGTIYAALALSVVNFILFSVTWILYTINMFRHRTALANAAANGQVEAGTAAPPYKTELPVRHA